MDQFKFIVVGDNPTSKKNELLISFVYRDQMIRKGDYIPTGFDPYQLEMEVDSQKVLVNLFEICNGEDAERLRPLDYHNIDVFITVFAIDDPDTFQNIMEKWVPETNLHCPKVPQILVGTQMEFRNDKDTIEQLALKSQKPVSYADGACMARNLGFYDYVECSVYTKEGLKEVFESATRVALLNCRPKKKVRKCAII